MLKLKKKKDNDYRVSWFSSYEFIFFELSGLAIFVKWD